MAGHVRRRGDRWQARYPDPLKGGTHKIERTFRTKHEAERFLTQQQSSLLGGIHVDPRRGDRPFREVADAWRGTWGGLEAKTRAGYDSILENHVLPRFGPAKVAAVSTEAVQDFMNELATRREPNTVRRVYTVTRLVLRVAVERGYLAVNPCDAVRLPKPQRNGRERDKVVLTPAEVRKLAEAVPERYRVPVYVAAYCGLRAGELWALRRRDIDVLRGTLTVAQALSEVNTSSERVTDKGLIFKEPKTAASKRQVALGPSLRKMLVDHLAAAAPGGNGPDDLVFPSPTGRPVRHNLFYKRIFKPAVKAALAERLHGLRFHDLRHTSVAIAIQQGAHPKHIQVRLGHEDIRTTMNVYGHMYGSEEEALAEAMDAAFTEAQTECTHVADLQAARWQ